MTQVCEISNTELSVKGSFALTLLFQDLSFKGFPAMLFCTVKKMCSDAVNWLKGEVQPLGLRNIPCSSSSPFRKKKKEILKFRHLQNLNYFFFLNQFYLASPYRCQN